MSDQHQEKSDVEKFADSIMESIADTLGLVDLGNGVYVNNVKTRYEMYVEGDPILRN